MHSRALYSRAYAWGWAPVLVLLALPIASFTALSALQIAGVLVLIAAGHAVLLHGEHRRRLATPVLAAPPQAYWRAVWCFSILSIVGCWLVAREQASILGDSSFENLQERYVAMVQASLEGNSSSSILSSIGNLVRSFFFVALVAFVAYTRTSAARWKKLIAAALIGLALAENFQLNVSRLQFIFYIICLAIAAHIVAHPWLKKKWPIVTVAGLLSIFMVITTNQRFTASFGDDSVAADYIARLFGVQILPLGSHVIDQLGVAVFTLSIYLSQSVAELIRLIADNPSPYALGRHSLFLVISPVLRLIGFPLTPGADAPLTNQGLWWGFMGDLYIDFGILFPVAFLLVMWLMARTAIRFGTGPVYGLTLRCLTAGMLFVVPYTGIFNTYAVSYFGILALAAWERKCRRKPRVSTIIGSHAAHSPR